MKGEENNLKMALNNIAHSKLESDIKNLLKKHKVI